ncbi:MAG: branched-chain amino acid ABC transporter permease [Acidimicrobiaceae bacterium]|nr:branched-chain amino acid ABC transporter permease [Acidimicrobiaceae bacterium]
MKSLVTIREGSAAHWAIRIVTAVLLVAILLWVPTKGSASLITTSIEAMTLMSAAMALNLVLGYTGQISIGHSAFLGIGAYTTGIMVSRWGFSPWVTFPVAFGVAFFVGVLVSFPAARIKGVYLALVTLALGLVFPQMLTWKRFSWLTGGGSGLPLSCPATSATRTCAGVAKTTTGFDIGPAQKGQLQTFKIFGHDFFGDLRRLDNKSAFWYWIALSVVVVIYLACRGVVKSRVGRSLIAIRDNETAAAVMGVNLVRTKAFVFGLSAGLCALPGCVVAIKTGGVSPEGILSLTVLGAITFLIAMVIGGAGSLWGPILGSTLYVFVTDKTGSWADDDKIPGLIRPLFGWSKISPADGIFALLLIILMFVAPRGIAGLWKQYSPLVVRVLPRPAGTGGTPEPLATVSATETTNEGEPQ